MTHILIMSGTLTGGAAPRFISLERVENAQTFGAVRLDYVASDNLHLTRVANVNTFGAIDLEDIDVTELTLTTFANANTFGDIDLTLLPFVADNAETTALLAEFTDTYSTTEKRQIDTLITEFKDAGIWSKFDWYGNAYWAHNEHDALLNWVDPTQTLVAVGAATWHRTQGLSGTNPMINSGRYKSGWDIGDGPHSTNVSFAMFCNIVNIAIPQNGMLPMGCWILSSPGPATPFGSFMSLSPIANTGFAGAYSSSGEGNTGFAVGDGTGVWVTSRLAGVNKTFHDGVQVDSDSVSIVLGAGVTHADGICVAGSTGSGGTTRSFPGTQLYWGWSSGLTLADANALEDAFQAAILPILTELHPEESYPVALTLTNPGAESGSMTGWTQLDTSNGTAINDVPSSHAGSWYFAGAASAASAWWGQVVALPSLYETDVDNGWITIQAKVWQLGLTADGDTGGLNIECGDGTNFTTGWLSGKFSAQTDPTVWTHNVVELRVPPGTREFRISFRGIRNTGTQLSSYTDEYELNLITDEQRVYWFYGAYDASAYLSGWTNSVGTLGSDLATVHGDIPYIWIASATGHAYHDFAVPAGLWEGRIDNDNVSAEFLFNQSGIVTDTDTGRAYVEFYDVSNVIIGSRVYSEPAEVQYDLAIIPKVFVEHIPVDTRTIRFGLVGTRLGGSNLNYQVARLAVSMYEETYAG